MTWALWLAVLCCLLPVGITAGGAIHRRVLERFLRYAALDTASDSAARTLPTSEGQRRFADLLVGELRGLGLSDARLAAQGYVYATLPATPGHEGTALPVLGFICHLDTVPLLGSGPIRPIVHPAYAGGDLVLPGDPTQVLSPREHPRLRDKIGSDIVTSDGRTILGADDKAGIAEVLTAIELLRERGIPHGPVAIAFTPDEETGRGMEGFDVAGWGASYAFTVDGEEVGELNDETFNAASATVVFTGHNCHPGSAKGVMVNALYAAARFLSDLPPRQRPEAVDGRVGYQHPHTVTGEEEEARIKLILRDFSLTGLRQRQRLVRELAARTARRFPGVRATVTIEEGYRNMKPVIARHPFLIAAAEEAMRRVGLTPIRRPIRGGTDGAVLSYKGIPCPNLFCGCENPHSRTEWIAVDDMVKAVETIVELIRVWPEHVRGARRRRPEACAPRPAAPSSALSILTGAPSQEEGPPEVPRSGRRRVAATARPQPPKSLRKGATARSRPRR
ncbi:MAG: Tripeptide aminopeptidase [Candidatus Ozemobacter sibiricus]|uniref:Peptidase T n=1 Tax=Candidatus Ozemobacter sibiricus TaxID=2268124 RepID=A0A367ZKJ3_9BACT|nr:MAG: Tripeptide aminopeptidase [Candidatus Ozemobacter sibiricus]